MSDKIHFTNICRNNKYKVNERQIELFDKYVLHLLEWNKKINLVSRKDTENIWIKHILSSVALLFKYKFIPGSNIIDVGTGGGLPGIPLAIMDPDSHFMLIDSIQKKINAVDDIVKHLGLTNVQTKWGRAEELCRKKEFANHHDYVIARAVASITEIVKWCKPFLKISLPKKDHLVNDDSNKIIVRRGSIILLKGGDLESEIEEAKIKVNPKNIEVYPIVINGIDSEELFDKKIVVIQP